MQKVILFHTGAVEVIGRLSDEDDEHLTVDRPMVFRPVEMNGQIQLDLIPYSLANPDGSQRFNRASLLSVAISDLPPALERFYIERTTSIVL